MPTPRVIDISHHQTIPKDFTKAKEAGIVAVIHKLSEGSSYVDPKASARLYLAQEAGLKFGWYHFLRPGNMQQQAEFFVQKAMDLGLDNDMVLVADHEDAGVPGQSLKQWLDIVENMTNRSPVVYSGHVLKDQLKGTGYRPTRRLWLCHYSSTPTLPEGVDKYWLWQFTDKGKGSDYGIDGYVDLNDIGAVPVEEFLAGWSGYHGALPDPAPEPTPPELEIPVLTLSADRPVKIHLGPNITVM